MIRLMKNTFYKETETKEALVNFITSADRLSMGNECFSFEKKFAIWQERKFATFVANGSAANLILIQALLNLGRLKKGDKVGFSAVTWSTNVMPLIQLGLEPVPIDCELETLNISSAKIEDVHRKTALKAIFITNALGFCHDLEKIAEFCNNEKIILLEDNCESLGSIHKSKKLGNFGLASTFSTFVGHHMSTIEGGLVCTDDEELHNHIVMCRAHGWDRNLSTEQQSILRKKAGVNDFYATYTFHELAYNVRPTEIQGFLGNVQINYLDEMIEKRENNFQQFQKACMQSEIIPLTVDHMDLVSNFAMPIICRDKKYLEHLKKKFRDAQVEIRPIIAGNMLRQPFYKKHIASTDNLPNSDLIHDNGFYFGNHPDLDKSEIHTILLTLETV